MRQEEAFISSSTLNYVLRVPSYPMHTHTCNHLPFPSWTLINRISTVSPRISTQVSTSLSPHHQSPHFTSTKSHPSSLISLLLKTASNQANNAIMAIKASKTLFLLFYLCLISSILAPLLLKKKRGAPLPES